MGATHISKFYVGDWELAIFHFKMIQDDDSCVMICETFELVILGHKKGACGSLELVFFELRGLLLDLSLKSRYCKKIEHFL